MVWNSNFEHISNWLKFNVNKKIVIISQSTKAIFKMILWNYLCLTHLRISEFVSCVFEFGCKWHICLNVNGSHDFSTAYDSHVMFILHVFGANESKGQNQTDCQFHLEFGFVSLNYFGVTSILTDTKSERLTAFIGVR